MIENVEMQLLSSCLRNQECLSKLMQYDRTLFQNFKCQKIFDILKDVYEKNEIIDTTILFTHLEMLNDKNMNPVDILNDINKNSDYIFNFDYNLKLLHEKNNRNKIALLSRDLYNNVTKGMEYDKFVNEMVSIYEKKFENDEGVVDLKNINDLDEFFKKDNYCKTGILPIDDILCGLFNGQITIIAARPTLGKTTMALQIAKNKRTLFFSLEMKKQEIYAKLLSSESDVETWKIIAKRYNETERESVFNAHLKLKSELNITLFDNSDNFSEMLSKIKIYQKLKNANLIVIDYLQLIHGGVGENNNLRIANISRQFKKLAMQLNIPIVALSQLSRGSADREPELHDLRDSGALEQDAGQVIFIWEKDNQIKIKISKNKLGRIGKVENLMFVKEYSRFDEETGISEISKESYLADGGYKV